MTGNGTFSDGTSLPGSLMTIFGATGDLTKRLLLPSIYNLAAAKVLPDSFRLIGVAMEAWDDAKFREHITTTLAEFWGSGLDDSVVDWLTSRAKYQKGNFDEPASFREVKTTIESLEKQSQSGGNRLFYLAVAPNFIATVSSLLAQEKLLSEDEGSWRRLVIEKPFGHDLSSAIALNKELQKSLREDQIYRIDHFAGKDSVQDLAVFRFSNSIMEPIWNRSMVDHVQITAAETVGLEGRAGYYEKSGALRDMVPNHMAEILSLVAMEPPVSSSASHMRDKQVELLQSVRKLQPEEVDKFAVRGQYGPGSYGAKSVPGYRAEPGVTPESNTETYIALKVEIDNWRWAGVPFYLRTGKRLSQAITEVVVNFRQPPAKVFPTTQQASSPNRFFFNLQPKQSVELLVGAKAPGLKTVADAASMVFNFPAGPFGDHAKGYERLLHDVMSGDPTLFQRAEFVEEGWKMVQPLLDAWSAPPKQSFPNYAAGSSGPPAANDLLSAAGHMWNSLEES